MNIFHFYLFNISLRWHTVSEFWVTEATENELKVYCEMWSAKHGTCTKRFGTVALPKSFSHFRYLWKSCFLLLIPFISLFFCAVAAQYRPDIVIVIAVLRFETCAGKLFPDDVKLCSPHKWITVRGAHTSHKCTCNSSSRKQRTHIVIDNSERRIVERDGTFLCEFIKFIIYLRCCLLFLYSWRKYWSHVLSILFWCIFVYRWINMNILHRSIHADSTNKSVKDDKYLRCLHWALRCAEDCWERWKRVTLLNSCVNRSTSRKLIFELSKWATNPERNSYTIRTRRTKRSNLEGQRTTANQYNLIANAFKDTETHHRRPSIHPSTRLPTRSDKWKHRHRTQHFWDIFMYAHGWLWASCPASEQMDALLLCFV